MKVSIVFKIVKKRNYKIYLPRKRIVQRPLYDIYTYIVLRLYATLVFGQRK